MDDSDLLIQAGFSTAKMEAETRKVIAKYEEAAKRSAKKFDEAMAKVSNNETLKATAREIDRLSRKYDPAYAGAKKYERGVKELNRAVEVGAITNKEYEQGLERLVQDLERGGKGAGKFGAAMRQGGGASRSYGHALQNVGFQVGDFATQVGAGTSATQALGQQLPQLLGAFGAFGAGAGAAAAILIPLGSALYKNLTGAVDLEEQMKALSEATDAYVAAAEAAATPIETLREKYGDLANEIAAVNGQAAIFAQAGAEMSVQSSLGSFAKDLGGFDRDVLVKGDGRWDEEAKSYRDFLTERQRDVLGLRDEFDLTREEAEQLAAAIMSVRNAADLNAEQQVAALKSVQEKFASILESNPDALGKLTPYVDQTSALFENISKVVGASLNDEDRRRAQIMNQYLEDERRYLSLIKDRGLAEEELAEAREQRDADRISRAETVLESVDREIEAMRNTKGRVEAMQAQVESLQEVLSYLRVDESGELREVLESMAGQLKGAKTLGEDLNDVTLQALEGQFEGVIGRATKLLQRIGLIKDDLDDLRLPDAGRFESEYVARSVSGQGAQEEELVRAVAMVSKDLGIAAKDLLTAISYETGGTFDPWQAGQTTQWGQHRGLIQWGEPQRARYGVRESSTITEQVQAAGRYLQDAGVQAGDGLLRIYAAINAGNADRINASDANNGGAPGTVLDKVRDQMGGHKARAEGLLSAYSGVIHEVNEAAAEEKRIASETQREREREAKQLERLGDIRSKYADLIRTQVQDAEFENSLVGKSIQEQARLRAEYMLTQEAKRRGIDLNEKIAGSEETWAEAIKRTSHELAQQAVVEEENTRKKEELEARTRNLESAQNSLKQGLIDAIVEGKNFSDVLGNVAKMLAKAALEAALFGKNGLFSGLGGGGTGGGSLFGGAIIPGILHSGGIAGSDGYGHGRAFSASTWTGATRYHSGGIAGLRPDEVPAILEKGEVVLPNSGVLSVPRGGGSNDLTVNIHNAPEGEHQVRQSDNGRTLDILIERKAIAAVTGPKGQQAMRNTFGIRPTVRGA